jgi:hypothetical protein
MSLRNVVRDVFLVSVLCFSPKPYFLILCVKMPHCILLFVFMREQKISRNLIVKQDVIGEGGFFVPIP